MTPETMTVTAAPPAMVADDPAVVTTKVLLQLGCCETDAAGTALTVAVRAGAIPETKKPTGYDIVIELPPANAPPGVVVNANVAVALVLPVVRSDTVNAVNATWLPMEPAKSPNDATVSALVAT